MKKLYLTTITLILTIMPTFAAEPFIYYRDGHYWGMAMPDDHWFSKPLLAPIVISRVPRESVVTMCDGLDLGDVNFQRHVSASRASSPPAPLGEAQGV